MKDFFFNFILREENIEKLKGENNDQKHFKHLYFKIGDHVYSLTFNYLGSFKYQLTTVARGGDAKSVSLP